MNLLTRSVLYGIVLIFTIGLGWNCQPDLTTNKQLQASFYYWKSIFALNNSELDFVKKMNVKKLYVKFFDVKHAHQQDPSIVAKIKIDWTAFPKELDLCPVVYITNEVFLNLDEKNIDDFASTVFQEINSIAKNQSYNEVQIDCDWTGKTQSKYFTFLKKIKTLLPSKTLSGTIRLHQIKYQKTTGIPPLDRGMLMIYNIHNPTIYSETNSIFDEQEVQKYIEGQSTYPIDMDIALPLFCWSIHFDNKRFKGFLNNLNNQEISKMTFLKKIKNDFYQVEQDTVIKNQYLRIGDEIKVEEVKIDELFRTLTNSLALLPNDTFNLSLFHLDEDIIKQYNHEKIKTLFDVCN